MTATEPLDVEISLVNTQNRDLLRSCLQSIPAACEGLRWHLTLVDNASTDGSDELTVREFPWVQMIQNRHRLGFSANHNQVIRPVLNTRSARFVLILNEDTALDPGSVARLLSYCEANPGAGAVGPEIRGTNGAVQASFFKFPALLASAVSAFSPGHPPRLAEEGGWLNGSCVLVRSEALQGIGTLDERFFIFYEDTDLGRRLHQAGWNSAVVPAAGMLHHGHRTVSKPAVGTAMERQMLRSEYLYWRKHGGRARARALLATIRLALSLRALKALVVGGLRHRAEERRLAELLLDLARYDPRDILPHELAARTFAAKGETGVDQPREAVPG